MNDELKDFGNAIKEYLLANNLTQVVVAGRLGVSLTYLSQLAKGQATPSFEMLSKINKELGLRPFDKIKNKNVAGVIGILQSLSDEDAKIAYRIIKAFAAKNTIEKAPANHEPENGVIYFIRYGSDFIKIGKTRNIVQRLARLERETGTKLRVIKTISGYSEKEKSLHLRFKKDRVYGEMFRFSKDIKLFLKTVA